MTENRRHEADVSAAWIRQSEIARLGARRDADNAVLLKRLNMVRSDLTFVTFLTL